MRFRIRAGTLDGPLLATGSEGGLVPVVGDTIRVQGRLMPVVGRVFESFAVPAGYSEPLRVTLIVPEIDENSFLVFADLAGQYVAKP